MSRTPMFQTFKLTPSERAQKQLFYAISAITVTLLTGCTSSPMEHLELQAKTSLSSMCENNEPDFSDINFATTIENYYKSELFFQENKKFSTNDEREIENIYEEAWSLGRRVGEFDTEASFWGLAL
ncbi:hypothetical protein [Marinomonas algicola]|uniref:hypothetical protein n=1 Tax=Marinomonas algicola TaxID=2773454 RepID=UPI001747EB1F|nr:hypothetical protein [Marinomonas algicola]